MECEPSAKVEVAKLAVPATIVPVPSALPPSLNVTVPVAADGVTVAVNVSVAPDGDGLAEDVSATADASFTVCVSLEDVLVL
jgi:hypothetical protein